MAKTKVPQAHARRHILAPFGLIGPFDVEPIEQDSFEGSLERAAQTNRIARLILKEHSETEEESDRDLALDHVLWVNSLCIQRAIKLHNASVPRPAPRPAPKPKPEPEPEPVPAGIVDMHEHLRKQVHWDRALQASARG